MKTALVVGAGLSGIVTARELAEAGYEVTIIDSRNHIGGNSYDYIDPESGVRMHKYGPHIWHTSNETAQAWMSRWTSWTPYRHRVMAKLPTGECVPFPPNLTTVRKLFPDADPLEVLALHRGIAEKVIGKPRNGLEQAQVAVGYAMAKLFFAPYTRKMWGIPLEDLAADVVARIAVKEDENDEYFPREKYQGLPTHGYTAAFESALNHERIHILLNTSRKQYEASTPFSAETVVFTSEPIDEYFNCCFGALPWRSIRFKHVRYEWKGLYTLPVSVVNFTDDGEYTRVTEWSHFPNQENEPLSSILTFETPCDYLDNENERYYPVMTASRPNPHRELLKRYQQLALNRPSVRFIGRCGNNRKSVV